MRTSDFLSVRLSTTNRRCAGILIISMLETHKHGLPKSPIAEQMRPKWSKSGRREIMKGGLSPGCWLFWWAASTHPVNVRIFESPGPIEQADAARDSTHEPKSLQGALLGSSGSLYASYCLGYVGVTEISRS